MEHKSPELLKAAPKNLLSKPVPLGVLLPKGVSQVVAYYTLRLDKGVLYHNITL